MTFYQYLMVIPLKKHIFEDTERYKCLDFASVRVKTVSFGSELALIGLVNCKYSTTNVWSHSHTQLKDQTCSIFTLSPGVSLSLGLVICFSGSGPCSPSLPPSLHLYCCCISLLFVVTAFHFESVPSVKASTFRAEASSHRRYWNMLPKQHWGWTLVLNLGLLMLVCVFVTASACVCV